LKGCAESVEIPCGSRAEALHLRNTINSYRSKVRKSNTDKPHFWEPLYGTIVSFKKENPTIVTLRPRVNEFSKHFESVGIGEVPLEIPDDPLEQILKEQEHDKSGTE